MKKRIGLIILQVFISLVHLKAQFIQNPILAGFYPDPSICRVGSDYYIVNSSFAYYPGLPIFHSTDLVNWKQLGYAMDRPEQLNLDGAGVSRGLFAPTIRYYNGVFYIMYTLIDKGGNFIINATNPSGPWSNPTWLPEVKGIDPSIDFIDDKAYITFNSDPPNHISLWDGHRTIRMFEFDYKNLKVVGEEKLIVNGGSDISKKPIWIEGPHLYKKDGFIYLLCAEGGTGYNHSEVVFRSKNVFGPYESYNNNPILTQRTLNPKRPNPITTTGHADLAQMQDGKWFAVFLGCRPYAEDFINNGRETFMAPVEWNDGWPIINPGFETVQYRYNAPSSFSKVKTSLFNGNYFFKDDFKSAILNNRYSFLRTVRELWYNLNTIKKCLDIRLLPQTAAGNANPAFIGFRQAHLKGMVTIKLSFYPKSDNEKSGLTIFQSEKNYYYLCQSLENGKQVVQLYKSAANDTAMPQLLASQKINIHRGGIIQLRIKSVGNTYAFYFADASNKWQLLKDNVDTTFLSTKVAGGFVGCMYAMYATSNGLPSTTIAQYLSFQYQGYDDVYMK